MNSIDAKVQAELSLAIEWHRQGEIEKAEAAYLKILAFFPDHAVTLNLLGLLEYQRGDFEKSIAYHQRLVSIKSDNYQVYTNLSAACNQQNKYADALRYAQKGLEYAVNDFALLNNMGKALSGLERFKESIVLFKKIIDLAPERYEGYFNIADTLKKAGKLQASLFYYRKASDLDPANSKIQNDMGTALNALGLFNEAMDCYQRAIRLNPLDAFPYHNLGNIFLNLSENEKAVKCLNKAISLCPSLVEAHISLGIALEDLGRFSDAIDSFDRAIKISPDHAKPYCHLVRIFQNHCYWEKLATYSAVLDTYTHAALEMGIKPEEDPFLNLSRHCNPLMNYKVAKAWSDDLARQVGAGRRAIQKHECGRGRRSDKITIGYLSNNFKNHPTAHLIMGLFRYHNRDRFNIFCYSYGKDDNSIYRKQIKSDCDRFVDIVSLGHFEAAQQIRKDEVDIIVDLVGQMRFCRAEISALRPAPIQVRWLGMAGTSGADFFDYIITDRIVTPEDQAQFYSETFAYMPHTYQINNDTQIVAEMACHRKDFGLPENAFVYASFCSVYKVDPIIFRTWMRILKRVPGSVLWLLIPSHNAQEHLKMKASMNGIEPERIVFTKKMDRPQHIARIGLSNLCLDTGIVNGAATTSEELWAEVPVLTVRGGHFASRMAASILSAMQLPELVAATLEDYENLAVKIGLDLKSYQNITAKVKTNKKSSALFDTQRFVKHLETLYQQMWDCFSNGEKKKVLEVRE